MLDKLKTEITVTVSAPQGAGKTRFVERLQQLISDGEFKEIGNVDINFEEKQS